MGDGLRQGRLGVQDRSLTGCIVIARRNRFTVYRHRNQNIPICPSSLSVSFNGSPNSGPLFFTLLILSSARHAFISSESNGRNRSTGGRSGLPGSNHRCQSRSSDNERHSLVSWVAAA